MKTINVLLIGLGRVGARFYEKFRELGEKKVKLLGVCERDPSHPLLTRVAKDGIPVYSDYREALIKEGTTVDIILDTTNVAKVKNDLRHILEESGNHKTVLLPLIGSYLLWYMASPDEELVQDHEDTGY
ncbi:MAG: hypothetical protein ACYDBP_08630 [Leptospirales bacterium]